MNHPQGQFDSSQLKHPFFGMIEILSPCNSKCVYCYCWKSPSHAPQITPDVCQIVFSQMASLGIKKLIITGGEPLLHRDLAEIIKIGYANRLHTSIVTNGLSLTEKRLSTLMKAGLLGLTLSLDTLDPITYREHRGVPFKQVQKAITIISQLAQNGDLAVSINCVLSALNYQQVPHLVQSASECNIPVMIQPCNTDSRPEMSFLLPSVEQIPIIQNVIEELINLKQQGALLLSSVSFLRNIVTYWAKGGIPPVSSCYYGHVNITIKHNGDIVPCWRLPTIGNIHTESLIDVWHGSEFAQWRQRMLIGKCPGCWLACSFDWQTLWHTEKQINLFWQDQQSQQEFKCYEY